MTQPLRLEINNQYKALAAPTAPTRQLCRALEASNIFPIGGGDLSLVFVSDKMIARIHSDFMDDPSPTDVITFPANPTMQAAGEIIVSVDHAINRASEFGQTFSYEMTLYIVHGWLHLAGYDDRTPEDRQLMRQAEVKAFELLKQRESLPSFTLRK